MPLPNEDASNDDVTLASWAQALSHPARIAILRMLARPQKQVFRDIVEVVPLSEATVRRHLAALMEAGLVEGVVEGDRASYALNGELLENMRRSVDRLFDQLTLVDPCFN